MITACNTTLEDADIQEIPLWDGGLKFHHLGLIIAAVFGLISVIIALFLVVQHALHYSKPSEQRHIIRILLMIPVYSTVSFLSYLNYKHAVYFQVLRDCYEAFAIASFFTLLCHYVAPNLHEQKNYFRTLTPKNWFWGVFGLQLCTGGENRGPFRKPRSGLTWFNIVWVGVFQYCFIRVLFTIVSVITEIFDRYCEHSNSPVFAHIWVTVFDAASVTIAMFCLIQFYIQLRVDLAEQKPFMKVLCIKLVIFFSFWQSLVISFLTSATGPLQPTEKISYPDLYVGVPSVMLCIEMAFFAVLHLFAFSWKPYSYAHIADMDSSAPKKYKGGPLGFFAFVDALNPWDMIKASARGFRWLFVGVKHRHADASYEDSGKLDAEDTYLGPTCAGTGAAATELQRPSQDSRQGTPDVHGTPEDDRRALLRHSAQLGQQQVSSPPSQYGNNEYAPGDDSEQLHPGFRGTSMSKEVGMSPMHGDQAQPSSSAAPVHPALRAQSPDPEWDHWAGRQDRNSMRPPTYRTGDPDA
ncbi:hypothetical protein LTR95_001686 [Oleoguttula sp. CCFEE 5521]